MDKTVNKKPTTTREALLERIEQFLVKNPSLSPEGFGWAAIKDTSLVARLRSGKDVTTRKLDGILRYMAGQPPIKPGVTNDKERKKQG